MNWLGRAESLAGDIREPGYDAAALVARAWRARVHPEATRSLATAAMVLTGGDAGTAMWAHAAPCTSDTELLGQVSDLEAGIAELALLCESLRAACRTARTRALAASEADGLAGCIADCGAALEVLGRTGRRLDAALKAVRMVPADIAEHYEVPYQFVRRSGPLPHDGDFLTGTTTRGS